VPAPTRPQMVSPVSTPIPAMSDEERASCSERQAWRTFAWQPKQRCASALHASLPQGMTSARARAAGPRVNQRASAQLVLRSSS